MLSVDLTSTLSQTTVSTLRAGWTRHRRLDNSTAEDIGGFDSATLGFPPSFVSSIPPRFVPITVADYGGAQVGQGGGQDGVADDYYAQGQLTNIRGRHQLKAGVEYRTARSLVENPYRGANLAAFNFTRSFTSLRPNGRHLRRPLTAATRSRRSCSATPPARNVQLQAPLNWRNSYVAGVPPGRLAALEPADGEPRAALGLRSADDRARRPGQRRASTTTASRWSARPVRRQGFRASLRGGLTFADGAIYSSDLNNFGPRAGFTYQVNDATVVRGGYGLTFLPADTDRGTVTGFSRTTAYVASLDAGRTPANRLSNPYPTGLLDPLGSSAGPLDGARHQHQLPHQGPRDSRVSPVLDRRAAPAALAQRARRQLRRQRDAEASGHAAGERSVARADPARRRLPEHAGAEPVRRPDAGCRRHQHRRDGAAPRADAAAAAVRHDQRAARADRLRQLLRRSRCRGRSGCRTASSCWWATPAPARPRRSRRSTRESRSTSS